MPLLNPVSQIGTATANDAALVAATSLADDLNNIRTQLRLVVDSSGNWDDAPAQDLASVSVSTGYWGSTVITSSGVSQFDVPIGATLPDTDYAVTATLSYVGAGTPSIYSLIVTDKAVDQFTVRFSGNIDAANDYVIDWIAREN